MLGGIVSEEWLARMYELYRCSPVHALFGMELIELGQGRSLVEFDPRPEHLNAMGAVHGGIIATILDSALLQSVRTRIGPEDRPSTLELKINYLAPAVASPFRCRGRALRVGGTVGVAEAVLSDAHDDVVAASLGTIFVKRAERG